MKLHPLWYFSTFQPVLFDFGMPHVVCFIVFWSCMYMVECHVAWREWERKLGYLFPLTIGDNLRHAAGVKRSSPYLVYWENNFPPIRQSIIATPSPMLSVTHKYRIRSNDINLPSLTASYLSVRLIIKIVINTMTINNFSSHPNRKLPPFLHFNLYSSGVVWWEERTNIDGKTFSASFILNKMNFYGYDKSSSIFYEGIFSLDTTKGRKQKQQKEGRHLSLIDCLPYKYKWVFRIMGLNEMGVEECVWVLTIKNWSTIQTHNCGFSLGIIKLIGVVIESVSIVIWCLHKLLRFL